MTPWPRKSIATALEAGFVRFDLMSSAPVTMSARDEGVARVMTFTRLIALVLVTLVMLPGAASAQANRFEITSIKAVRPALVDTLTALQKKDIQAARDAFEAYDSGWNGVEVYVNFRDIAAYKELEGGYQNRIATGLNSPNPDVAAL